MPSLLAKMKVLLILAEKSRKAEIKFLLLCAVSNILWVVGDKIKALIIFYAQMKHETKTRKPS